MYNIYKKKYLICIIYQIYKTKYYLNLKFFKLFLTSIKYKLYIYDITSSTINPIIES